MFYAWRTASDFGNGFLPVARGRGQDSLAQRMSKDYKTFLVAFRADGAWVDLTTYGPGNEGGREVSEGRTPRYIRSRARRLEESGQQEVTQSTPLSSGDEVEPLPEPAPIPDDFQAGDQRQQVVLSVDPVVVKGIFEFLALEEEQRTAAINALSALSVSAAPFSRAVEVMLDDEVDLVVDLASSPQEDSSEG